jgi:hypothetical protein
VAIVCIVDRAGGERRGERGDGKRCSRPDSSPHGCRSAECYADDRIRDLATAWGQADRGQFGV